MLSAIILYSVPAIALLRCALEIYETLAQGASRRRLEHELHLALTRMLATTPPETVTAVQNPDSTASTPADRSHDAGSATITSA